jgi:WS/DGAT/MGAT family acyltransferase
MRQLSGSDWSMLAADTPHAQNMIAPLMCYDPATAPGGIVGYDDVVRFVESRLHISDSFRERLLRVPLELDRPYWLRDGDFDIEYHIRHLALPAPGDWRQLCTQVARVGAQPLDLTRPPWELYIIDGLDAIGGLPPGCFATLLKMHHAAVDGVAGAEIVAALHDLEPDADRPPPSGGWKPDSVPGSAELLRRATVHGIQQPVGALRTLAPAVRSLGATVGRMARRDTDSTTQLRTATRFNHTVGPHRVWGSSRTQFAELKKIRAAVPGASINDVALAVVGGAMRSYLLDKDELPDESLVALMPISVRPTHTQRASAGADLTIESAPGGNRFVMSAVSMATDVHDPIARIERIVATTAKLKSQGAQSMSQMMDLAQAMPGNLTGTVQRALVRMINRAGRSLGVHTIVTNVPGPQAPMYFCGAKAVFMSGMAPVVDGMGLINAVGGYGGIVPICFTADRDMMPDPEFYEGCIDDAVAELLERAG